MLVTTLLFGICMPFVYGLNCRPYRLRWDPVASGHCGSVPAEQIAGASLSSMFDIMVILIPQQTVWQLQTTRGRKLAVSGIFSLGAM